MNDSSSDEHAVIICVRLSDDDMGAPAERQMYLELEDAFLDALDDQPELGEVDGIEEGDGFFRIFCYGPDADALFGALEDVLREQDLPSGSFAIKRFGAAEDQHAREERIALSA